MKLFKVHSQKMKNDKVICLQDKFNDIGPDCFDGFAVECLVLAETTRFVRNYAFSGVGNCKIYLPKAIEEIESYAFENISPSATFYCVKGSYAEQVCIEHNLNISYDVDEVSTWKEQQQRAEAEEKARLLEAYQLEQARLKAEEEAKRKAEEEARIKAEEEAKRKAEEAKKKAEEEAKIKAEEAKKKAEEEAKKKANEAEKGKTPPGTRMIRVNVIDEVKGPVKETMDYATLPDGAKSLVVQNVIHMHRTYENGVVKKVYTSEGIYKDKLKQFELKSGNKVVQPKPAPQKPAAPGSPNTITMYIYDKANGVRTQVVDRKDFPQNEVSHIEGNEAFVHKRIIDGRVQGRFITRNEFDYLVKGGDPAKVEVGESTKVCPHCKAKISAEVKFCTNCGKPLDAPAPKPAVNASADDFKVCSKCGKKNESKYYFCVDCGNKI